MPSPLARTSRGVNTTLFTWSPGLFSSRTVAQQCHHYQYQAQLSRKKRFAPALDRPFTSSPFSSRATIAATASQQSSSPTRPRSETRCRAKVKRKVALTVAYEGSPYHGFQRNAGVRTVSDELEDALHAADTISDSNFGFLEKIKWQVAARTDRGVSAAGNLVSAKLLFDRAELDAGQALAKTKSRINHFLPRHIRVLSVSHITGGFNARACCEARWYEYLLPLSALVNPALYQTPPTVDSDDSDRAASAPSSSISSSDSNDSDEAGVEDIIKKFDQILKNFEGSHLFHNFTVGIDHSLPPRVQSRRFIMECRCDPAPMSVKLEGGENEGEGEGEAQMLRIRVRGQSFMLHQIRKMVSLAVMIMQGRVPNDAIQQAFNPKVLVNVAPAPAAGLYLDCCRFGWYNEKQKSFLAQPLSMVDVDALREEFIESHILPSIARRYSQEDHLRDFFNTIDTYPVEF